MRADAPGAHPAAWGCGSWWAAGAARAAFRWRPFPPRTGYQPDIRPAQPGAYLIEGACAHTEIGPLLDKHLRAGAEHWRSMDDIAASLDACIRDAAARDETANDKIYRQLVY